MTDPLAIFAPLFTPRSIAVLGASPSGTGQGNNFIRALRAYGFDGVIRPIHQTAEQVEGLPAFPSLAATPEPIDYAYVAIGAERVADALSAGAGRLRFAQVMSSGFAESGGGTALQDRLVAVARQAGIRVLGPNCLGTHSPRGRMSFVPGASAELGSVGILAQSGGLSLDMLRRGERRGLRFSGLVTIGNCADLGPAELLEFFLADPATRVIGLYLEDVRDARALFEVLRRGTKPVVLLKGGQTAEGQRAAASHTGSLASDHRLWQALARQTGTALVNTLDQFIDALLAFQVLTPRPQSPLRDVVLFGNGGGTSVLASDAFARQGLRLTRFGAEVQTAMAELKVPAGSSLANPIDVPAGSLRAEDGRIGERILANLYDLAAPDAVVMHLNMPVITAYPGFDLLGRLMEAAVQQRARHLGAGHFVLVLRSDGEPEIEARRQAYRERAIAAGIPVFDEIPAAAGALAALAAHEAWCRAETEED